MTVIGRIINSQLGKQAGVLTANAVSHRGGFSPVSTLSQTATSLVRHAHVVEGFLEG
jgi:hypothetical protein